SRRIAFVVYEKGDNYIGVVDVDSRHIDHVRVPGLDAITNVAWSPDGHTIAISGQRTGVTDLFLYDLDSKAVKQLTNDKYADLQPAWSPDGKTLAFMSDRGALTDLASLKVGDMNISTIDVATAAGTEAPRAAILPPLRATGSQITSYLSHPEEGLMTSTASFTERGYSPNLHVAYIGPPTVGVGADQFGFGVNGSISAYFTDILGQHNVGFTVEGGGSGYGGLSIGDQIGGEVFYLNQLHRFHWGADVT